MLHRVLHDDAVELLRAHRVDERLARVEADELDLARLADVLQREQHADRRRLVRREHALEVAAEAVEQVLRRRVFAVSRVGAGILVGRDDRDAGIRRLDAARGSRCSRSVVLAEPSCVAQHEHLALAAEQLCRADRRRARRPCGCRSRRSSRSVGLEPRVDDHRRHAGASSPPRRGARARGCRAARARCRRRPGS